MHQPRIDVRTTPFKRAARGFDPEEVQAFLQLLAPDYDEAHAERDRLREALAALARDIDEARGTDRSLMRLLATAEADARVQAEAARGRAARILESAEARAAELVAAHEAKRLEAEATVAAIIARRRQAQEGLVTLIGAVSRPAAEPAPAVVAVEVRAEAPVPTCVAIEPAVAVQAVQQRGIEVAAQEATEEPDSSDQAEDPAAPPSTVAGNHSDWRGTPVFVGLSAEAAAVLGPAAREVEARLEPGGESHVSEPASIDAHAPAPEDDREAAVLAPSGRHRAIGRWTAGGVAMVALISVAALAWPGRAESPDAVASPGPASAETVAATQPGPDAASVDPVPTDPLVVRLSALRACWVRVVVDGRTESRTLEAGETVTRGAKYYVELRVGDASAIAVDVNGTTLPPLGNDGQVVDRRFNADARAE